MKIEYWTASDGRTYWHMKARNGKITDQGSYAYASNARRMFRDKHPNVKVVKVAA